jgi:adenosylcobinamide-GDP ribazoletransferase
LPIPEGTTGDRGDKRDKGEGMKLVEYFLCSLVFFTRIPVGRVVHVSEESLIASRIMLPVVGIVVGGIASIGFSIGSEFLPKEITVLLVVAMLILLTGAFHEDALADSVDGFGGGVNKKEIITIMKDSTNGTYGNLSLILSVFSVYLFLLHISDKNFISVLIVSAAMSRFVALPLMWRLPYVRHDSLFEKAFETHRSAISGYRVFLAGVFTLFVGWVLLGAVSAMLFACALLACLITGWYYQNRLGGATGDCFGATIKLAEIVILFVAVVLHL